MPDLQRVLVVKAVNYGHHNTMLIIAGKCRIFSVKWSRASIVVVITSCCFSPQVRDHHVCARPANLKMTDKCGTFAPL